MVWLAECACPRGHNLCGMPAEVPDGLTELQQQGRAERMYGDMQRTLLLDMERGLMPRACPYCGAPSKTWVFYVRKVKDGVTMQELEHRCREVSRSNSVVLKRKDVQ